MSCNIGFSKKLTWPTVFIDLYTKVLCSCRSLTSESAKNIFCKKISNKPSRLSLNSSFSKTLQPLKFISNMKKTVITSLFLATFSAAQAQVFTCNVSQRDILLGNYIEVEYKVEGAQNARLTTQPDWGGFDVVSGPNQSSSIRMVNGKTDATISYKWYVQPRDTGQFVVPSATVKIGDTEMTTEPIQIEVFPNPDGIIEKPDTKDAEDPFQMFSNPFGQMFELPEPAVEPKKKRKTSKL